MFLCIYLSIYLSICQPASLKMNLPAKLPQILKSTTLKKQQSCEFSSSFEFDNVENEEILRAECWADGLVPTRFAFFPLHLSRVLHLPRKKWGRVIQSAAPATQNHLNKPENLIHQRQHLSGSLRPDLLTSLMNMSFVPRLLHDMHLCRPSSNVPDLPTLLKLLQNSHACSLLGRCRIHWPVFFEVVGFAWAWKGVRQCARGRGQSSRRESGPHCSLRASGSLFATSVCLDGASNLQGTKRIGMAVSAVVGSWLLPLCYCGVHGRPTGVSRRIGLAAWTVLTGHCCLRALLVFCSAHDGSGTAVSTVLWDATASVLWCFATGGCYKCGVLGNCGLRTSGREI